LSVRVPRLLNRYALWVSTNIASLRFGMPACCVALHADATLRGGNFSVQGSRCPLVPQRGWPCYITAFSVGSLMALAKRLASRADPRGLLREDRGYISGPGKS